MYITCGRCKETAAIELYSSVQQVYKYSIDGRVFNAKWWITMNIVLNCTPSIEGTCVHSLWETYVARRYGALQLFRKRNFCTPAVRTCTAPWWWSHTVSNRLCTHPEKTHSALFTRCMTPNDPHGNLPLGVENSAQWNFNTQAVRTSTAPWRWSSDISHMLRTHSEKSRSALYSRCMTRNDHPGKLCLQWNFRTPALWTCRAKWWRTLYV